LFFIVLLLGGCFGINSDIDVASGTNVERGLGTVNGSVRIGHDSSIDGDVESVNGSIDIGANTSVAGDITTVNGKISIGAGVSAENVDGVNGSIDIGEDARIDGNVGIVNGLVVLQAGGTVGGELASVNGPIRIEGGTVGSVKNHNGGIVLENGSRVLGELRIKKSRFGNSDKPITVIIHADCEVGGPLVFERPANLRIHESAIVGEIQGAEPEYFND
jgi:hypothetical protein